MTKPKRKDRAADGRPETAEQAEERARTEEETAAAGEAAADAASNGTEPADPPAPAEVEVEEETEEDPLAKLAAERDEYLQLAQRAQADFENYRKRAAKDMAAAGARAKIGLVRDLLPVIDNLERALASADGDSALAQGVRLVLSDLNGVLAREGVSTLEPEGEQFDPTFHEALSTRSEDGAEAGVVLDVVEKGYRLGDTVIRPARVVVSA
ncbi:MAG: nucleotide exchange factor GrpE [Actinobacteria bacterium]|nr:MAG: nucleotide exchange factor GrpE [Actinomycetota bacterium]